MTLRIGHRADRCTALGPGVRAVLWLQGCRRRCSGCVAPELWDEDGGRVEPVEELVRWVGGLADIDGVTISGGEPMDQAEGLAEFCRRLREVRDLSILCYTGYTLDEIEHGGTQAQRDLLTLLDILIDGPYIEERHTDLLWRGSDNQRVILLSPRHADLADRLGERGNRVEWVFEPDGLYWMGIPPRGFRAELDRRLAALGVTLRPGARSGSESPEP